MSMRWNLVFCAMSSAASTLVVAHDAGGAAELAAWLKHSLAPQRCDFLLAGPAATVVPAMLGAVSVLDPSAVELSRYTRVLTATSGAADWERQVISRARHQGVPVTSMLDHWVNYRERFLLDGKPVYPDSIWVVDRYAEAIAGAIAGFPPVTRVDNHYLRDQAAEIARLEHRGAAVHGGEAGIVKLLYVSEPADGNGYCEFQALESFLGYLSINSRQDDTSYRLRLRLHPKEPANKYAALMKRYDGRLCPQSSHTRSLAQDCAWSDWVVGCQTKAMVVALAAGKKVFSSLPPEAPPLALPHRGIVRLFPASAQSSLS